MAFVQFVHVFFNWEWSTVLWSLYGGSFILIFFERGLNPIPKNMPSINVAHDWGIMVIIIPVRTGMPDFIYLSIPFKFDGFYHCWPSILPPFAHLIPCISVEISPCLANGPGCLTAPWGNRKPCSISGSSDVKGYTISTLARAPL